jgi:hypothetical protein
MIFCAMQDDSQESYKELVKTKVKALYPETKDIDDYDGLKNWWMANSLKNLFLEISEQNEVRLKAWNSIRWSAMKLAVLEDCVKKTLSFYNDKIDSTSEGISGKDLTIAVVGSVGRMETSLVGDIDLNIFLNVGANIASSSMDSIELNFVRHLPGCLSVAGKMGNETFLTYNIQDRRIFVFEDLKNRLREKGVSQSLTNLAIGYHCIRNPEALDQLVAIFSSSIGEENLRTQVIELMEQICDQSLAKSGRATVGLPPVETITFFYKVIAKSLLMIAATAFPKEKWVLVYFCLAEELLHSPPNWLKEHELRTIRSAVIAQIKLRGNALDSSIDPSEITQLFRRTATVYKYARRGLARRRLELLRTSQFLASA